MKDISKKAMAGLFGHCFKKTLLVLRTRLRCMPDMVKSESLMILAFLVRC